MPLYELKRVMVGLDLTEMDDHLIAYVNHLVDLFDLDVVYFLHVAKQLKLPDRIRRKYPDIMAPIDESIENEIRKKIEEKFVNRQGTEYKIEIKEGDAIEEILHWTGIKHVDLILMGRKLDLEGSGTLALKVARVAHCSILFVPEGRKFNLEKILVSVDFSKTSALALEAAVRLNKRTAVQIVLHNAYEVPSGYHFTGKSFEEFKNIMKQNAQEDAYEFVEKNGLQKDDVMYSFTFDDEEDPGERAYEVAKEMNVDLMMIASRGRTGLASLLLGSVAEKMIRYDSEIPLLIVKDRKENLGFFQALLRL
ncbi:universal stress protein [Fulvivirga sedimenti]|uniref:Universal stress protein n=1 Tax=Fulvivirga sedimenti TaxID=2879465 RepID=A0A9X1KZ24_9BACT|nr:universal stress protein [Fulvivirga sedimenti]MCA6078483.1 universal stress protein [Fulvivirga sedimenti]